jgi:hypothetical protein
MKINSWSVVKSPIGISLMQWKDKNPTGFEVCVSVIDDKLNISIHQSGIDAPIMEMQHNTTPIPYFKTEKKQPKNTKAYRDWVRKETNAYVHELRKKQSAEFVPPVSLSKVTKKKGASK